MAQDPGAVALVRTAADSGGLCAVPSQNRACGSWRTSQDWSRAGRGRCGMTRAIGFSTMAAVTIREHFQQVTRRLNSMWVALAMAIAIASVWRYPNANFIVLGLLMGAVLIGPILLVGRLVYRCPSCGAGYQQMRKQQAKRLGRDLRMYWDIWDACPNCQLSFDAPWPNPKEAGK